MKNLIAIITIMISAQSFAATKQPLGKLLCWDANDSKAYIVMYGKKLNDSRLDYKGNRSLVLDFTQTSEHYGWQIEGRNWRFSYSVTECEDDSSFFFNKKALKKVLSGKQKFMRVEYEAYWADEDGEVKTELLCRKKTTNRGNRPTFIMYEN